MQSNLVWRSNKAGFGGFNDTIEREEQTVASGIHILTKVRPESTDWAAMGLSFLGYKTNSAWPNLTFQFKKNLSSCRRNKIK